MNRPLSLTYSYGFTLMELMIAMLIFAIMSSIAYSGLQVILDTQEKTGQEAMQLKKLQSALIFLTQDIQQAIPRSIRDGYGTSEAALRGGTTGTYRLEFTRTGISNPLNRRRSNLKRIAYHIDDEKLFRLTWKRLDRAHETEPNKLEILDNIKDMEIRYLDNQKEWHNSWPPATSGTKLSPPLPVALETNITTEKWGQIRRVIQIASK